MESVLNNSAVESIQQSANNMKDKKKPEIEVIKAKDVNLQIAIIVLIYTLCTLKAAYLEEILA